MKYLEKSELARLFTVTQGLHPLHHQAMLCEFFLGSRISQILDIRGEDIFERDGRWVVLIRAAKGGNEVVRTLHQDDNPAFDMTPMIALAKVKRQCRIFGGLDRHYFNRCLRKYADRAGIHSSFAHSHVLRHSCAMAIFDATQRIGAVSQFLAHRSPSSAFVYLQENDSRFAQEAMDNLKLAEVQ